MIDMKMDERLSEHVTSSSEAALSHSSKLDGLRLSPHLTSSSEAALSHSSKLDGLRLSPHFTLAEMCKTSVKKDNTPGEKEVENLRRLCGWLELLRDTYNQRYVYVYGPGAEGSPIIINSGYRSPKVNEAVGGAIGSNHLTGCAVDIRCAGIEQALRYATILLDISDESGETFDELLLEKKGSKYWIHFAVRPTRQDNRRHVRFIALR